MAAKRILVVDDEPKMVEACARVLKLGGFEVQGATGGTEAIALYKRESFDLAIVDLKMPDVDGLEVLAAFREYNPDAAIIIFTAYGTKEHAIEALRLGASEFLEKPLDAQVLTATVRRVLERGNGTAVRGHLRSFGLPSIVQINCAEGNQARLRLKRQGQAGDIFFADGNVVHAILGSRAGEEVVYELLTWEDGEFELEMDVTPPERSITVSWSGLLLEGMRRIDERAAGWDGLDEITEMEVQKMATKKRSEVLAEHLETLLEQSADVNGAIIVGSDGLVLASNMPLGGHDATRVGAEGAALLGLSKRTLGSLKCGDFEAAILEGSEGWVVALGAGEKAVVLGLTDAEVNLGMALVEMRDIAGDVAETLS